MAIVWTPTINKVTVFGDERVVYATLTSNGGSYTAGGDSVTNASIGLDVLDFADGNPGVVAAGTTGFLVNIIPGAGSGASFKVQLLATGSGNQAALAEFSGTPGNLTTISCEFRGV